MNLGMAHKWRFLGTKENASKSQKFHVLYSVGFLVNLRTGNYVSLINEDC